MHPGQHPLPPAADHDHSAVTPVSAASSERWLLRALLALILFAVVIRVPLLFNALLFRDETEHLHAAWAVAQGQVPYRDFWQLHPPLLYYLMAPVFTLMGEDLRIIYVGRALMLVCLLLTLLQLYRIAQQCFDALTGALAVCLLSYVWLWWRPTYDVRPDIPQTLVVLVGIWWFMRAWARRSRSDFLAAGAILGVAFWLLIKTLFPLVGLTLVFVLSTGLRHSRAALRECVTYLLHFLTGLAVPVLLGSVLLWMAGAWPAFVHRAVMDPFRWPTRPSAFPYTGTDVHLVFWVLALVGAGQIVSRMVRARVVDEVRLSPLLAGCATAVVYLFLMSAPNAQSALPFLPLAAMYAAEVLRWLIARALAPEVPACVPPGGRRGPIARLPSRFAFGGLAALLLLGVCGPPLGTLLVEKPPFRDGLADTRLMIHNVLALTSPRDSVFDAEALYIFRPHATYYYYLSTKAHLAWVRSGLIPASDIISSLRRSQCKVVIFSDWLAKLPPTLLGFLRSHYVSTGFHDQERLVLVPGQVVHRADLKGSRATVSLVASAEYAVRPRGGSPRVTIDGRLYQVPLFLALGEHQVGVEGEFDSLTIFYSRVLAVPSRPYDRPPTDHQDRTDRSTMQGDGR